MVYIARSMSLLFLLITSSASQQLQWIQCKYS